jgi:hypothetical protein
MPTAQTARAKIAAALGAQAARTAHKMIKTRDRTCAERPHNLDAVASRLCGAPPETLIAVGAELLPIETGAPSRWFGFGGEVAALNAR